jgi:hypothetical protein
MSHLSPPPADDCSMNADNDSSDEEETASTTVDLQKHLDNKFGVGLHHPAGFVERNDTGRCHMLLLILAPRDMGVSLPNCNLATRTGVAKLLRDAFQLTVGTLYQYSSSARAWTFPVDGDDADRLRAGVFRLSPNLGFALFSTYGAPTKKAWAFVTPVTENVDLSEMKKAIRALSTVKTADTPKRVQTREGLFTEKALVRVQWEPVDLTDAAQPSTINILRGCYVRSFHIAGSMVTYELRSLPPCSFCGFLNHFVDACPYPQSLSTAPLLELTAPIETATSTLAAGPAKAPKEPKTKKTKGKTAKEDPPKSDKAKGKRKAVEPSESPEV